MLRCKICNREFVPVTGKHYVSRDNDKTGAVEVLKHDEVNLYDTFDCPTCGCQVIAQERKRTVVNCSEKSTKGEREDD